MAKKVAVLIKDKQRQYEGLRSSLGLLMEFHIVSMIVLNHEIELTEEYKDNMEFIDEMEGTRYSNVPANVEKYGFEPLDLAAIPKKLKENDIIIAF
ncbi:MAG: hypothetical protein QNJ26_15780 [Desulfobacterales bacterium]|nr:hypothetical protein [Desulfobacterales bacterium]